MTKYFEILPFSNLEVFFATQERAAAELIGAAGEKKELSDFDKFQPGAKSGRTLQ